MTYGTEAVWVTPLRSRRTLASSLQSECGIDVRQQGHADTRTLLYQTYVRYMLSPVRLSVVYLSVTLMHPTQAVEIFGNIITAVGTLAML